MLAALAVVGVIAASAPCAARADDKSEAREHFQKGTKAFDLGAYDEAIAEYSAAYRIKDDPALLYNIAQAHRLANHAAEALRFYRMFLVKNPDAPNRQEVDQKINELQKLIEQQKRTQNLPPDQPRPPGSTTQPTPPPPPVEPKTETTPPATAPPPAEEAAANPGRTKKIAGIAVAGVGVVGLVLGATFGGLAVKAGDDLTRLDQNMQPFDPSKQAAGKTDVIVEGVCLGIGGAAVVTGVVLYVLGHREAKAARAQAMVVPVLAPGSAGASALVRF